MPIPGLNQSGSIEIVKKLVDATPGGKIRVRFVLMRATGKGGGRRCLGLQQQLSFVGDAALEQTAQRVTVRGDYGTNFLAVVGGTFRYDF